MPKQPTDKTTNEAREPAEQPEAGTEIEVRKPADKALERAKRDDEIAQRLVRGEDGRAETYGELLGEDPEAVRRDIAARCLAALLANPAATNPASQHTGEMLAMAATTYADALITHLQR